MVEITRRTAIGAMAGAVSAAGVLSQTARAQDAAPAAGGRFKQSASRWCYGKMELGDLCAQAKAIGLKGLDLIDEADCAAVIAAGLEVSLANGPSGIADGWCHQNLHKGLIERSQDLIPKLSKLGVKNMIVLAGNRKGMSYEEALKNCAAGLREILPFAEKNSITVILELLNSKRDHKDYCADSSAWGVKLVDMLGAPNFTLLYDIYHMQIMEGDVIDTIRRNHAYFGHYHTGGVPGRHEIDNSQELNYRTICEAIAETGFTGFLAHEFVPERDPMTSLREAFEICNV